MRGWVDLVQTLVIYARPKHQDGEVTAGRLQLSLLLLEYDRLVHPDEIHLVHEQEYDSTCAELAEIFQTIAIVFEILVRLARLDIEHIDENADVLEYRRALCCEIRVHERILAAAVPEVEDEIA